jgi:TonB family protein
MKKLILILFALMLLWGCEQQNKIEVIPDYTAQYLEESKVTKQVKPEIEDFEKHITDEFLKIITRVNNETDGKYTLFPIGYNLLINEKGEIDKIAKIKAIEIEPKGEYIFNNFNKLMDEITKNILPKMEQWQFIPAKHFDKNIGMQKNIKALFANDNGKIIIKKPFNLSFDNFLSDYFVAAEEMPEPIGGIGAIQKNITYPEIAKRAGVEGRVYVKAYVDSTGTVVKTELLRGIGAGCDEMAMDAVKKVQFTPGKQRGKSVNTQVTIPILFKLK